VGDHHDRGVQLVLQAVHEVEDLRLHRHVERRGRLVGDEQLGVVAQRHRDHHALAHAARELVRVGVGAPARLRDPDEPSISTARSSARALETSWWVRTASTSWRPMRYIGCREDSGSWKIIAIRPPRTVRSSLSVALSRSIPSNVIEPLISAVLERVSP
jgi:hypothetical protein